MENYGFVEHKGKILTLQQDAYLDGINGDDYYRAHAVDEDGTDYNVRWEIIREDAEDESDACDWTQFTVRRA